MVSNLQPSIVVFVHALLVNKGVNSSHLVSVVVPAVGSSDDEHPVLPTVRLRGGEGGQQPDTEAEQQEHELKHVLGFCVSPAGQTDRFRPSLLQHSCATVREAAQVNTTQTDRHLTSWMMSHDIHL